MNFLRLATEALERGLEALRGGDAAIVVTDAAFEIAGAIEWLQDFFRELGRFAENRFAHIGRCVAEARKVVVAVELEHIVQEEADVFQRGFVTRHVDLMVRLKRSSV